MKLASEAFGYRIDDDELHGYGYGHADDRRRAARRGCPLSDASSARGADGARRRRRRATWLRPCRPAAPASFASGQDFADAGETDRSREKPGGGGSVGTGHRVEHRRRRRRSRARLRHEAFDIVDRSRWSQRDGHDVGRSTHEVLPTANERLSSRCGRKAGKTGEGLAGATSSVRSRMLGKQPTHGVFRRHHVPVNL